MAKLWSKDAGRNISKWARVSRPEFVFLHILLAFLIFFGQVAQAEIRTGRILEVDSRQIYIRTAGRDGANPIVFVHGTPGSWSNWEDYLRAPGLQQEYELIAMDRPGFGASSGPVVTNLEEQARLLKNAVAGVNDRPAILVGHSLGGPIVTRWAADYPERVAGLILLAPSLDPELERIEWYQHAARWPVVKWLVPRPLKRANREVFGFRSELEKLEPHISGIHQPVFIMHGESDRLVQVENTDYAQRKFTGASHFHVARMPDMNHFLIWLEEESVTRFIRMAASCIKKPDEEICAKGWN